MEKTSRLRPTLTLLILFGCTTALLAFTVDVRISNDVGVKSELPKTLGDTWTGHEVLFCQDLSCGRSWLTRDLEPDDTGAYHCPETWSGESCGSMLHTMSVGEKLGLPGDTTIFKKQYFRTAPSDASQEDSVYAAVVLSGADRRSIHRPEVCMRGQGNKIERANVIEVPIPGRGPLDVMVLDLTRPAGRYTRHSYYAYWFVGKDRETALHWERSLWMGLDRILRNVSHRWAYIAVSGDRPADLTDTSHHEEIKAVVGKLYPEIVLTDTQ